MAEQTEQVFRIEQRPDNVALLIFDAPGQKVNTFTHRAFEDLDRCLDTLEQRSELKGLILASGKRGSFIAGADINEMLLGIRGRPDGGAALARLGQRAFDRLSRLPFPTVAAINGACLGGGLEAALACDFRLATDSTATALGQPEVKLGIIPGWGGTQRLPRVVGVPQAVEMITTGEPVGARRAFELGLVFDAVAAERLLDEATRLIDLARSSDQWPRRRQQMRQPIGLSEDQARFIFETARSKVLAKTGGHYPAPMVAVEVLERSVNLPLEDGLKVEAEAIGPLLASDVTANLIHTFFATRRLAKDPGVDRPDVRAREIGRVGIVGAGLMGSGIATAMVLRGLPVTLIDLSDQLVQRGLGRVRSALEGRAAAGRMPAEQIPDCLCRVTPSTNLNLLADCQLVIEAIVEDEPAKCELFDKLNQIVDQEAVIGTNTSTISVSRLASRVQNPKRFVGLHFFNPADRMALVEVIRGTETGDEAIVSAVALAKRIGKTPVVVKDCAGFLVNRVLLPYMNEALVMVTEGASLQAVDKAARKFGMPMGPITLHDVVGLDTALFADRVLAGAYPDRMAVPRLLEAMVEAGRLGQKSGAGFWRYSRKAKRGEPDPELEPLLERLRSSSAGQELTPDTITDRLFLTMLLEAVRALDDGIVRNAEQLDMSLQLGIGFPPFRGGILRWADALGADKVLEALEPYAALGGRYEPPASLREMARTGASFY